MQHALLHLPVLNRDVLAAGPVAREAVEVAREVARRVVDPDTLARAVAASREQTTFPRSVQWDGRSVAQGDAGIALLCAAMDATFPDEGWDRRGHARLAAAVEAATRSPQAGSSLFAGAAGIGLTAVCLAAGRDRYGRLLDSLDRAVAEASSSDIARIDRADGGPVSTFDAVSGLAGVAAYLLLRREHSGTAEAAATASLAALARLLGATRLPPRWHTPADWVNPDERHHYPHGNLNCGLAHGLPGPVAVLAVALADGVEIPGGRDALTAATDWLMAHRSDDEYGPNWPNAVPLTATGTTVPPLWPSRAGWCYGAPGVARALWLAGSALDDDALRALALEAIRAVAARPADRRWLSSPTFCHGAAGLLQVLLRFAADTGRPDLRDAAGDVCRDVLAAFEPDSLLGYRNVEPGDVRVDQPGLLDGAPGVALVLLTAATDTDPVWDRLFLLS